jgi:ribonuclease HI
MTDSAVLTINIDGAARGNPGPAAFAFVILRDGQPVIEEAGRLGSATNNVAEYTALVRALERAAELGGKRVIVRSDSELLVKQMNGLYRVKHDQLKVLHDQASQLRERFRTVSIVHVPRSANSHADRLCNEVLDGVRKPAESSSMRGKQVLSGEPTARQKSIREEALACLRSAAAVWAKGGADVPSAEEVWDQLWSILEEGGVLRHPGR